MELILRFVGFLQTIGYWLTYPFFWIRNLTGRKTVSLISDPILLQSASQLARKIRAGELKSQEVVRAFVDRIREVNPLINSVVEQRYEEALSEAREVDVLVQSGTHTPEELESSRPFLGVPVSVKESIAVKGMSHCVGSLSRRNHRADEDAACIRLIRKAGAIPVVVTNTPELCLCWESNNLVTGRTNNPYDVRRTPGGSSGGEAALIAAGGSVLGVGSDIAGSIRIPAMYSGIFGHKPTSGVVSIEGHYPNSDDQNFENFLTIGPLGRYAEDLAPMLEVLAGQNTSKLKLREKVDMKKLRVFYMEDDGGSPFILRTAPSVKREIHRVLRHLIQKYGTEVEKPDLPEMRDAFEITIALYFGLKGVPDLLQHPNKLQGRKSIVLEIVKAFLNLSNVSLAAVAYYALCAVNGFVPSRAYSHYLAKNNELREKLQTLLGDDGVLILPTHPTPAQFHDQIYVKTGGVCYAMIFNTLGLPATHCHMGYDEEGLPIGVQVVAAPYNDHLALAVATDLDKAFGGWVQPAIVSESCIKS